MTKPEGYDRAGEPEYQDCPQCNGNGYLVISVAVCCNQPTRTGECCGNAIEGQDTEGCSYCGGNGYITLKRGGEGA